MSSSPCHWVVAWVFWGRTLSLPCSPSLLPSIVTPHRPFLVHLLSFCVLILEHTSSLIPSPALAILEIRHSANAIKAEDIAKSLLYAVSNNIGQIAYVTSHATL